MDSLRIKNILIGLFSGFFSGLLGIGGAVVLVPCLTLILKQDQKTAQGTALLLIPIFALSSLFNYSLAGNLNIAYAVWLAAGSMFGIFFGATLAYRTPSIFLKNAFAVLMIIISLQMFFG
jgi:uncharacterized membrane protein YfcA